MKIKATINNFIPDSSKIMDCNTGHITNGHWMVLKSFMPKAFQDKIKQILLENNAEKRTVDFIFDDMAKRDFYEVKSIKMPITENEDIDYLIYECEKFQIDFKERYILYLLKHIKDLKIMASANNEPAKLIYSSGYSSNFKSTLNIEKDIGVLMPSITS